MMRPASMLTGYTGRWRLAQAGYRWIVAAAMWGLAAAVLAENQHVRGFEAWLASHIVAAGAGTATNYSARLAVVWFTVSTHGSTQTVAGLQITAECTVALLIPPFLLMTGIAVWLRRKPSAWPLVALAVSVALLVLVNQLRLLAVVWFIQGMGMRAGYYWGHTMVGSLITILGLAATLLVYAPLIVSRGGASGRR